MHKLYRSTGLCDTDSTHPLNDETLTFAKQIKMHIINPLDFCLNDKVQKVL